MSERSRVQSNSGDARNPLVCPQCGGRRVATMSEVHTFTYGAGQDAVELSAKVPVRSCEDCSFAFLDHVGEDICHEAVCQHLGVMGPSRIRSLRKLYGRSQAEFARITKLGEATLSRWERGIVVQNQAYDNYLYLLGFKENMERIGDKPSRIKKWPFDETKVCSETTNVSLRDIPNGGPRFQCAETRA